MGLASATQVQRTPIRFHVTRPDAQRGLRAFFSLLDEPVAAAPGYPVLDDGLGIPFVLDFDRRPIAEQCSTPNEGPLQKRLGPESFVNSLWNQSSLRAVEGILRVISDSEIERR